MIALKANGKTAEAIILVDSSDSKKIKSAKNEVELKPGWYRVEVGLTDSYWITGISSFGKLLFANNFNTSHCISPFGAQLRTLVL